jgi:hypothetical protein
MKSRTKEPRMKKITSLLFLGASLALGVVMGCQECPAQTATNTPPATAPQIPAVPVGPLNFNWLTNIPTVHDLTQAKLGLGFGALLKNGNVENSLKGDYFFRTNWMFGAELQNAPVSPVVDSVTAYPLGYRFLARQNYDLYAQAGARRTWSSGAGNTESWQGVAVLGGTWLPVDGGNFFLFCEGRLLNSTTSRPFSSPPAGEAVAGFKLLF